MATILGTNETEVATPRFYARVNGELWSEILRAQIDQRSYSAMGTFMVDVEASVVGEGFDAFAPGSRLGRLMKPHNPIPKRDTIDIFGGYVADPTVAVDKLNLPIIMSGVIDNADIDRGADLVTLKGRDRSSIFQESFIHQQFRNKTVAGAVKELAERHGFDTDIVDTGTLIGSVYEYDNIKTIDLSQHALNEWNLLTLFADYDGFAVFVEGNTLHYVPFENFADTIVFEWGKNLRNLRLAKAFGINSSRVGVELSTTKSKTKEGIVAQAGPVRSSGDAIIYRYVVPPNLPQAELQDAAELLALVIAQFEFIAELHTTGAPQQSLRNRFELKNGAPNFDGFYRLIHVSHTFGLDSSWNSEMTGIMAPQPDQIRQLRQRRSKRLGRF